MNQNLLSIAQNNAQYMSLQILLKKSSLEGDKSSFFANFCLKYLKIDRNLRIIA